MRVPNLPRAAINLGQAGLRRADRRWKSAARRLQRFVKQARRQQEWIVRAPELTRARARQGRAAIVRARRRFERFDDHVLTPFRAERRVMRALAEATVDSTRPVFVGPWTSEVGYEALYWLPFLRWAADRYGIRPERMIAVSRGGTQSWYRGIAAQYVEIFDLVSPEQFAAEAAARRDRGDQKQMEPSAFDRRLLQLASERLGLTGAVLWHPGLMYQMFRAFWHGDRSLEFVLQHARFEHAGGTIPPLPDGLHLPDGYAAAKFYAGAALPDTPVNRRRLHECIRRLAERMPVVMLDTAWSVDEHRDYAFDTIPNVTTLRPSLDPRTNLDLQTRVIAGARMFVGTCGGLAWLAPLLGVETLAVYEDDRYLAAHLYAARYAYRRAGGARFSTLNLKALEGVDLGRAVH